MPAQTNKPLIARRPLLMYFGFAYAFMWLYYAGAYFVITGFFRLELTDLPAWLMTVLNIVGPWMPSLAAGIVIGVCEGPGAVRRLFGMFLQFRLPARWYLAALIPVALTFAGAGIYRMLGGAPSGSLNLSANFWISTFVVCFFTGATGEEPGWRGFALPRLLQRYSPMKASLILSLLWSFWHLPLWLTGGQSGSNLLIYIQVFCLYNFSLTSLMTWIFMRTSHSLVPMVIAHFAANFSLSAVTAGLGLGPTTPVFYGTAGLSFVTVLILWAAGGLAPKAITPKLQPAN